jgi:WD40 repeat protein
MPQAEQMDDLTWQELRSLLDEEIARLPEKCRTAIVLCYFEGKSHEQAAKELGWPKRTLTNRLERGRELLRQRLVKRGITLSAGLVATVLGEKAVGAEVGAMLTINTVKGAMAIAAGKSASGGCFSAGAVALAEETLGAMLAVKMKLVVVVVALGLAFGGAGLAGYGGFGEKEQPAKAEPPQTPLAKVEKRDLQNKNAPVATDLYGDPLPKGALARLGTVRFRHGEGSHTVAYLDAGRVLAVGGHFDFGVCLFDAGTGQPLDRIPIGAIANRGAFSTDGKMLLTGGEMRLIDIPGRKEVRQLEAGRKSEAPECPVAFSPDGQLVVGIHQIRAYVASGVINLWDVRTGNMIRALNGHTEPFTAVAFSPNGKVLVSGANDNSLRVWDVETGKELRRIQAERNILSVAFSPNGKCFASAELNYPDSTKNNSCLIRFWQVETGKLLRQVEEEESYSMAGIVFSPDGKLLAWAGNTGMIRLWDVDTGQQVLRWQGPKFAIRCLAFSPSGKELATLGISAVQRWDVATGKEIGPSVSHTGRLNALQFTAAGKTLLSCGNDGKVIEWDTLTGRSRRFLFDKPIWPDPTSMRSVVFSSDGKTVAVSDPNWPNNNRFYLWDCTTGKEAQELKAPVGSFVGFQFSPDGKFLASLGDEVTDIWEVATGKLLHSLRGGIWSPVFSPDSKLLATCSGGNLRRTIILWDVETGKELRRWDSPQYQVFALIFGSDSKSLASSGPGSVYVWSTNTCKELMRFSVNEFVESVNFSPSGRVIAITQRGHLAPCLVSLWEVPSGERINGIESPQGDFSAVAFAPDGRTLATGGEDSTILIWNLASLDKATSSPTGPLTAKELDNLWSDLAGNARQADQAIWKLALAPQQSVPALKQWLQVVSAPAAQVAKLLADLDSDRFAAREKAAQSLDAMGYTAEAAMRNVVANNPALEMRQRLEPILANRDRAALRPLRAIDALEQAGTAEARQVLELLANEAPNPRVAEAARAAAQRLTMRTAGG